MHTKNGWRGQRLWVDGIKLAKVELSRGFYYCTLYDDEGRKIRRDFCDTRALARAWCERQLAKSEEPCREKEA